MSRARRVLLGQLASNGDCLLATTIARQIKTDDPNCHLTWAVAHRFRSILDGNPDVDEVWEVPYFTTPGDAEQWSRFENEAVARHRCGDFDAIFLTQISYSTLHLWAGSVRSSIFRAYPYPITVDVAPILHLSAEEVARAHEFARTHGLADKVAVVLFECGPQSGQSLVNPRFALEVAQKIVENPGVAVILSSSQSFDSSCANIIDGSALTLRETAELCRFCSLLIGCSSGISWISTSRGFKTLPMIQLVIPDLARCNSLFYDLSKRGFDPQIIEMNSYSTRSVSACFDEILKSGFTVAKAKFHQNTPLKFGLYRDNQKYLIVHFHWKKAFHLFKIHIEEYGFHFQFFWIPVAVLLHSTSRLMMKVAARSKQVFRR